MYAHRLRARLVLEILRVVACLDRLPARWPRRTTVAAAFVGAGVWTPGPVAAVLRRSRTSHWLRSGVRSLAAPGRLQLRSS